MKRTAIAIVYILLCITLSFLFVVNISNGIYNINKFTTAEDMWFVLLSLWLFIGGILSYTIERN